MALRKPQPASQGPLAQRLPTGVSSSGRTRQTLVPCHAQLTHWLGTPWVKSVLDSDAVADSKAALTGGCEPTALLKAGYASEGDLSDEISMVATISM